MLAYAFAAGVPASWVIADTVYGFEDMRDWLEKQRRYYVLAVPATHQVWIGGESQVVGLLAALLPDHAWTPLSAGEGSQGPRVYEWAWLRLPYKREENEGCASWLLVRRSLSNPSERAYYRVYGPAELTLSDVVLLAGSRWKIEEGFEQAKGEVGLDHYEVRSWKAWYRYVTLALLAYAFLMVMRVQAQAEEQKKRMLSSTYVR